MWILENKSKDEWRYITNDNHKSKFIVGRLSVDIVLPADSSISRQHAIFHIENNNKLYLEDKNSKYGTYYNGRDVRMSAAEKQLISNGDTIRFGVLENKWVLRQHHFNCMSSTLTETQQQTLENQLLSIGGRLEEKPHPKCTHLTMPKCSLTPKLLYALIKNIPIVTCEYWNELILAVKECKNLPKVDDYRPKADNVDLKIMNERPKLFKNRIFIFMDEKMLDTYKPIIEASSGTIADLQINNFKRQVMKPNVIVMEYLATSPSQNSQLFNEISAYLSSHGRRSIPDYEIAMAIMHCNTDTWCNPDYMASPSMPSMLAEQMQKCNEDSEEIFVPDTSDTLSNGKTQLESMSSMRVTESQTNNNNESVKRKREEFFNDDSDDDELGALNFKDFQVETASKTNGKSPTAGVVVRPQTPPPMSEKHNPIYVKGIPAVAAHTLASKKMRLLDDFVEDKSAQKASVIDDGVEEAVTNTENRMKNSKRARIAILTDDIEEDNLFDFNKPTKRQKQQRPFNNSDDSEPMQLSETVAVTENNKSIHNLVSSTQKSCRIADTSTTNSEGMRSSSPKAKKPFVMEMSTPKEIPKHINISSWISFNKSKCSIKSEDIKSDTDTNDTGINVTADNDECPMRIVTLNIRQALTNNGHDISNRSTIGTEMNAKVFKKFHNVQLTAQDRIIVPTKLRPIIQPKF